jgi:hypothetical protein
VQSACIWMLGEFGLQVELAPYLLEEQVPNQKRKEKKSEKTKREENMV